MLIALGFGPPARATGSPGDPPKSVLRVGTSGDYPPFSDWPTTTREPQGFSIDVARGFARVEGATIEWHRFDWRELERDLAAGRFDLVLSGVTLRPDRSIAGRFSIPLTESGAVVLVPAGSKLRQARDLDRETIELAVNAGGHLERTARRLFPSARIVPVADNRGVLDRLPAPDEGRANPAGEGAARERVDAVVTDTLEAPLWLARRPDLRLLGPFTRDVKAAWLPATDEGEARARRLDAWLLEAEASGDLGRLRREHGLPAAETARPLAALLTTLDERLSLMEPVAHAKRLMGRPVEDPAREARVLEAARAATQAAARHAGRPTPDPNAIDDFYRAQIEAAKAIQRRALDAPTHATPRTDRRGEDGRAELERRIRPALLHLGDRLARLLVEARAAGVASPDFGTVERALARHALPPERLQAIAASLRRVLESTAARRRAPPDSRGALLRPGVGSGSGTQDVARDGADSDR